MFEIDAENLAEWESALAAMFADPGFGEGMAATRNMIAGGRNEYWTIEAEGG